MEKEQRVRFEDLPSEVKVVVERMLGHRKTIRTNTKILASLSAIGIGGAAAIHPAYGIAALPFGGLFGILAYDVHNPEFRKELLNLRHALLKAKSDPKLERILKSSNYLVVAKDGSLVSKKSAPKLFGFPIGRRRVIVPDAEKKLFSKWKRNYLPRRKNKIIDPVKSKLLHPLRRP